MPHPLLDQTLDGLRRDGQGVTLGQTLLLHDALSPALGRDLRALQSDIAAWQRQTFGEGDPALAVQGAQKKLEQEVYELMLELVGTHYRGGPKIGPELADCFIMLVAIADRLGLDLYDEAQKKMAVNRARKWPPLAQQIPGQPVSHLKEPHQETPHV